MNQLPVSRRIALNVIILSAIVIVYVLIMTPNANMAVAGTSPIYRGTNESAIALECVVNWDAAAISEILDVLKDKNARITFFVTADWAIHNQELLTQMARDGHEIGCMGNIESGSRSDYQKDIQDTREAIFLGSGVQAYYYMPAGEHVSEECTNALRETGCRAVLYSVDILSGKAESPSQLEDRALKNPFGGELIRFTPTAFTRDALPNILDKLAEKGFMLKPVGEVLGIRII